MTSSPTAFQKVNDPAKFNVNGSDAGAGRFKVRSFKANDVIELERDPTHYGGEPYLDGVRGQQGSVAPLKIFRGGLRWRRVC